MEKNAAWALYYPNFIHRRMTNINSQHSTVGSARAVERKDWLNKKQTDMATMATPKMEHFAKDWRANFMKQMVAQAMEKRRRSIERRNDLLQGKISEMQADAKRKEEEREEVSEDEEELAQRAQTLTSTCWTALTRDAERQKRFLPFATTANAYLWGGLKRLEG